MNYRTRNMLKSSVTRNLPESAGGALFTWWNLFGSLIVPREGVQSERGSTASCAPWKLRRVLLAVASPNNVTRWWAAVAAQCPQGLFGAWQRDAPGRPPADFHFLPARHSSARRSPSCLLYNTKHKNKDGEGAGLIVCDQAARVMDIVTLVARANTTRAHGERAPPRADHHGMAWPHPHCASKSD